MVAGTVRAPAVESHGLSAHPTLPFALQATDNLYNGDSSSNINPMCRQVLHRKHLVQVLDLSGGLINGSYHCYNNLFFPMRGGITEWCSNTSRLESLSNDHDSQRPLLFLSCLSTSGLGLHTGHGKRPSSTPGSTAEL